MLATTENDPILVQPISRSRLRRLNSWQRIGVPFSILWLGGLVCQDRVMHDVWKHQIIVGQIANHYREAEKKAGTVEAFLDAYSPENDTDHFTRKELSGKAIQFGILDTSGRFASRKMRTASLVQWGQYIAADLAEIAGFWVVAYAFVWIAKRRGDQFGSPNGWERIGITLSLIYMVLASGWLLLHLSHSGDNALQAAKACSDPVYAQIDWCFQHPDQLQAPCTQDNYNRLNFCNHQLGVDLEQFRTSDLNEFYKFLPYTTIIPVAAVWLLVYSIFSLVRWIARGFSRRSTT